jgi:hypothetical protein
MFDVVLHIGVLILLSILTWFLIWSGRRFVEKRRRRGLTAPPLKQFSGAGTNSSSPVVCILAFSSTDCHRCHQLQIPALQRVLEMRGANVAVVEVDAPSSPELTQRYQVLTVPTTVVLDATGHPHAVNYGFSNTQPSHASR